MPKEKVQNDKQRSTKHTYKTKDTTMRKQPKNNVNKTWAPPTNNWR